MNLPEMLLLQRQPMLAVDLHEIAEPARHDAVVTLLVDHPALPSSAFLIVRPVSPAEHGALLDLRHVLRSSERLGRGIAGRPKPADLFKEVVEATGREHPE